MVAAYRDEDVECGSGKDANDENFPVGSFLIRADLRPHIAKFYAFARAADDIADSGQLTPGDKLKRLNAYEDVLSGTATGLSKPEALRTSLLETKISLEHGINLLAAFKQDAQKQRYHSLEDLLAYCRLSANPVGRYLLDLHGESPELYPASDALCTSLQILNHFQDCGEDRKALDRAYIPLDWLREEGETLDALDRQVLSPGFRRVMDRLLDVCDRLNTDGEALEGKLESRRLAAESGVITRLAKRLSARLRAGDPLANRIALSKADFAAAAWGGAIAGLVRPYFRPRARKKVAV